jgi:hypothetical protein
MIKATMAFLLALLLLIMAGTVVGAEMAKEGSGDYRSGKSGTFEILKMSEGRLQMNYDETGVLVESPKNSPFTNASFRVLGTLFAVNKKFKGSGAMVLTRPNGDQIFGTFTHEGVLGVGPTGGFIELIGGTGECTGIEGRMEMMPRPSVKSSKKGIYQGLGIGTITWKIP